jgi:hypothetical protein
MSTKAGAHLKAEAIEQASKVLRGLEIATAADLGPRLQLLRQDGEQLRGLAARNTPGSNTAGYQ